MQNKANLKITKNDATSFNETQYGQAHLRRHNKNKPNSCPGRRSRVSASRQRTDAHASPRKLEHKNQKQIMQNKPNAEGTPHVEEIRQHREYRQDPKLPHLVTTTPPLYHDSHTPHSTYTTHPHILIRLMSLEYHCNRPARLLCLRQPVRPENRAGHTVNLTTNKAERKPE